MKGNFELTECRAAMFQFVFDSPLLPLPHDKPAVATLLFRLPRDSHKAEHPQPLHHTSQR